MKAKLLASAAFSACLLVADGYAAEPAKPSDYILQADQVDYDTRGRPVMLSHEWHVADAFELIVNRRLSSGRLTE